MLSLLCRHAVVPLFILMTGSLFGQTDIDPSNIDIARDQYGVPHIFGETDAEVAYGLAWATCEDDFETLQWGLLASKAMLARHLGVEGARIDYAVQLLRARETVEEKYDNTFTDDFKKVMEGYVAGVNAYAKAHPKEVLVKKAFPATPKDMVTGYVLSFSLMSGVDGILTSILDGSIRYKESLTPNGIGSNAFAFNGNKTKDGDTYLAINSHQPIEGPLSWYEVHLHSEEGMNIVGSTFHGGMTVFHGTNQHLGWAHTYNDFDLVDVYELKMNPDNDNQYWYDGAWHELEEDKAKMNVKIAGWLPRIPVKRKIWWSKYGATLKTDFGVYAIRLGANMRIGAPEQWYRMNKATSFSEFMEAVKMQQGPRMTIVYGDKDGNIYQLSNGLVPRRRPGYNWDAVVRGDTSATLWTNFEPVEALPQQLNPDCGYVFNVNNSPFEASCKDENLNMANYRSTMGFGEVKTNRSERFYELMEKYEQVMIDWDDFIKIKYDDIYPDSMVFASGINLNDIWKIDTQRYPELSDVMDNLHQWNKQVNIENTDATVLLIAIYHIFDEMNDPVKNYRHDKVACNSLFVEALTAAKSFLMKHYGTIDVPLGDVQRLIRGDKNLPVGGGPDAIKACYALPYEEDPAVRKMVVGESYIQLVRFTDQGPQISSVSPFGASSKLSCPHSTDQMELFLNEERKPMSLDKETIYNNAEMIYHPL